MYSWGAGVLGHGSDLFNSEPKSISLLSNVKHIECADNTSMAITKDNEMYLWGHLNHFSETLKVTKPTIVLIDGIIPPSSIVAVKISQQFVVNLLHLNSGQQRILVAGNPNYSADNFYPYNPTVLDGGAFQNDLLKLNLIADFPVEDIVDIGIARHHLFLLSSSGKVYLTDLS